MPEAARIPPPLRLCRGCRRFVRYGTDSCDFCAADLAALDDAHAAAEAKRAALEDELRETLAAVLAARAAEEGSPGRAPGG